MWGHGGTCWDIPGTDTVFQPLENRSFPSEPVDAIGDVDVETQCYQRVERVDLVLEVGCRTRIRTNDEDLFDYLGHPAEMASKAQ